MSFRINVEGKVDCVNVTICLIIDNTTMAKWGGGRGQTKVLFTIQNINTIAKTFEKLFSIAYPMKSHSDYAIRLCI